MNRVLLAQAIGKSPASTDFRDLISASSKYGFTKGNFNSESIELTELGNRLTRPVSSEEELDALRTGLRNIPIFNQLLEHFSNSKLPIPSFLKNVLEREPFGVSPEWSIELAETFVESGKQLGFVRLISGSLWVITESGAAPGGGLESVNGLDSPSSEVQQIDNHVDLESQAGTTVDHAFTGLPSRTAQERSVASRQLFIAHGRNKTPLDQLKKILGEFGIPYVVAEEEANAGRPISQKVSDLMKACSGGIFIFTADEKFLTSEGNEIWRPRENVIFELGAASLQYARRIVIFKEESVTFPSDFSDLGYIEFRHDRLSEKAMELIRELVKLGAVRITASS